MTTTIQRVDDNFIIRLPVGIIENIKIKESEAVQVFEEYGRIIIQKSNMATFANDTTRPTISELFEGFEDEYEPVSVDWGVPVGKEIW